MASLITVFKLLRCIGLFPRRFLSVDEILNLEIYPGLRRQPIGKNESIVGPLSPFPLLMTIIFHITIIVLNTMYMFQAAKNSEDYGNDSLKRIGSISLTILFVWSSAFAGWSILINNYKFKKLNNILGLFKFNQNENKKTLAKFPRARLFWIVLIPTARLVIFVVYHILNISINVPQSIIWIVGTIEDEIIKLTIEFTFWEIAKLYRSIITQEGQLTLENCFLTFCNRRKLVLEHKSCSKKLVDSADCMRNCCHENVAKKLRDFNLLQTEKYIESIINCVRLAMTCLNYAIVFQMVDLVFSIVFGLYFGIIHTNLRTKLFTLFELFYVIPRLVLMATLSNTINEEVGK